MKKSLKKEKSPKVGLYESKLQKEKKTSQTHLLLTVCWILQTELQLDLHNKKKTGGVNISNNNNKFTTQLAQLCIKNTFKM